MTMRIGITGTRHGATRAQLKVLMGSLLLYYQAGETELHHGACVGVDEQAALLGRAMNFRVIAHPPNTDRYLSTVSMNASDVVLPTAQYLVRDRAIVHSTGLLIAAPHTTVQIPRSGTWYTYRYALGKNKTTMLITPDGEVI